MTADNSIFSRLADVRAWEGGESLSPLDFVALEGKPSLLFAYASLLDPALEEVDGRFFLANRFSKENLTLWAAEGVVGADAQRVINHLHMTYLMQDDCEDQEVLDAAATIISRIWEKTLPAGSRVEIVERGTISVSVTFFQS